MSVVVAFAFGDEFTDGFVARDVIARPTASGARRQARASDDDCTGAAVAACGGKRAQDCGHARRAHRGKRNASGGSDGGCTCGGGGGLEKAAGSSGQKLPARKHAVRENFLNDERGGDGAELYP